MSEKKRKRRGDITIDEDTCVADILYECPFCYGLSGENKIFSSVSKLIEHLRSKPAHRGVGSRKKGHCSLCSDGPFSRLRLAVHFETVHLRKRSSRVEGASSADGAGAGGVGPPGDGDSGEAASFSCDVSMIGASGGKPEPYFNEGGGDVALDAGIWQEEEEEGGGGAVDGGDGPVDDLREDGEGRGAVGGDALRDSLEGGGGWDDDDDEDDWMPLPGSLNASSSSDSDSDSSSDSDSDSSLSRLSFDESDDDQRALALLLLGKRHGLTQGQIKGMAVAFAVALRVGRSSARALVRRIDVVGAKASSSVADSSTLAYGGELVPFVGEHAVVKYLRKLARLAAVDGSGVRVVKSADEVPRCHRSFFGSPLATDFFDSFQQDSRFGAVPVAATVWFDGTGAWSRRNVTFEHLRLQILNFIDARGYPINIPLSLFCLPRAARFSSRDAAEEALKKRSITFELLSRVLRQLAAPESGCFLKFFGFKLDGFAAVQVLGVRGRFFPLLSRADERTNLDRQLERALSALDGRVESHGWGEEMPQPPHHTPRSLREPIWPFLSEFARWSRAGLARAPAPRSFSRRTSCTCWT